MPETSWKNPSAAVGPSELAGDREQVKRQAAAGCHVVTLFFAG
jgi:hypothetical protein